LVTPRNSVEGIHRRFAGGPPGDNKEDTMATAVHYKMQSDNIPVRYKYNPYLDIHTKREHKNIARALRHAVKQALKDTGD